jgi:LysR family transcriptional regulator for metE and metH
MFAVVHRDHPWADREYVSARHFEDQHVINFDHAIEDVVFYQRVLRPAGVMPKSWTKLPMTDAIVEMVRAGMGVAVLGRWSIRPYLESTDLRTIRVTRGGLNRTWYAATLGGQQHPPYLGRFIDLLAHDLLDSVK